MFDLNFLFLLLVLCTVDRSDLLLFSLYNQSVKMWGTPRANYCFGSIRLSFRSLSGYFSLLLNSHFIALLPVGVSFL